MLNTGRALVLAIALSTLSYTSGSAKEATPDQASQRQSDAEGRPVGGGKAVTITIIKRCPDRRELVIRANGAYGCAKDVVPPNN